MTDRLAAEAESDAEGDAAADVGTTTDAATASRQRAQRAAARASAFGGGVVAAGLGLGALAAVVLLLWIASPFPDSGLDGALHVSAAVWLLAQGADLVRTQTLSGAPAPVGVTPLLLSALPAWLLYRSAASAAARHTGDGDGDGGDVDVDVDVRGVAEAAGWLLGGYLTAVALVVSYASGGLVHVDRVSAALYVPVFAVLAVAAGTWTGAGRPALADRVRYGADAAVALRAAGIAVGVLAGGGALLGGASIAWHAGAVGRTFVQLSGPMAGRITVLLVAIALVPNMAVWAVSYALGPGFAVGAGSVVAPAGVAAHPLLPGFPLLAALPASGGPSTAGWATLALPALAGGLAGWSVSRVSSAWSARRTALVCLGAALLCGAAFAVLAAWAGGPMGTAALARFGPTPWATGAAALSWLTLITPLTALLLHHLRTPWHPLTRLRTRRALAALAALKPAAPAAAGVTEAAESSASAVAPVVPAPTRAPGRLRRWLPRRRHAAPDDGLGINPPDFDPLPWPTPPLPPPMPLTPPPPPLSPPPPESEPPPPTPPA